MTIVEANGRIRHVYVLRQNIVRCATSPDLLTAARAWLDLEERGLLPMTPGVRAAVAVTRAAVGRVGV